MTNNRVLMVVRLVDPKRVWFVLLMLFTQLGCHVTPRPGNDYLGTQDQWLAAEQHQQRVWLGDTGVSFLPPAMLMPRETRFYDPRSYQIWRPVEDLELIQNTSGWKQSTSVGFDQISYSFRQYLYGRHAAVTVANRADSRRSKRGRWDGSEPVADVFARAKARVDRENSRRRKLLSGTIEDHWRQSLQTKTIRQQVNEINQWDIWDEDKQKKISIHRLNVEKQTHYLREKFEYHFGRKREAVRGLPDNTAVMVDISGVSCVQEDKYEWLLKPVVYKSTTDGGLEHERSYMCPLADHLYIEIRVYLRMAPGIRIDSDALVKPLLANFQWPSRVS